MTKHTRLLCTIAVLSLLPSFSFAASNARERITLATYPSVSPDGKTLAFSWNGDIWSVPVRGGVARQLTRHPALDKQPSFSPDGSQIAFASMRDGAWQVYVMPASGGVPERLTFHSQGNWLLGWYPDGKHLLTTARRDHSPLNANRFLKISRDKKEPEELLFDDYAASGAVSGSGDHLLFTREGGEKFRKGYTGTKAQQIWLLDIGSKEFTLLLGDEIDRRYPVWKPDGSGFYHCDQRTGTHNLWEYDFKTKSARQCTSFQDDPVMYPTLSKDGSTMVFCHLFDLYRLNPKSKASPEKIDIWHETDVDLPRIERKVISAANEVDCTTDGLEVVCAANQDIWVMDTVLREPRQITNTPFEESDAHFTRDGKSILFVRDEGRVADIWRARPADPTKYWWQNTRFIQERITTDGDGKSRLSISPDGARIAFQRGGGDLWVSDLDGGNARKVVSSSSGMDYDWSPDGKWLVYTREDNNQSVDIYVAPIDGHAPPYDLSRYPYWEGGPAWSPDGKVIAYTNWISTSGTNEVCWVRLAKDDPEPDKIEKARKEALEKMRKSRSGKTHAPSAKDKPSTATLPVRIDLDGLHDRLNRLRVEGGLSNLFWSPKSDVLAFTATVEGRRGTYTLNINEPDPKPVFRTDKTGSHAQWLKQDDQIVWLCDGQPGSLKGDKLTPYPFKVEIAVDRAAKNRVAFGLAWRFMRDNFYDPSLNHRDWDAIYDKYAGEAEKAPSSDEYSVVMDMMLGELNASHTGFTSSEKPWSPPDQWKVETAHPGVRFDPDYEGPGWKVRDVFPKGPADRPASRIKPGEVVLAVDGTTITKKLGLPDVFNGPPDRDIQLTVLDGETSKRLVTLRPVSYETARNLLRNKWLEDNEKMVDKLSSGTLGYLHIDQMSERDFRKFEIQVYEKMVDKEGLVIDIRNNGGGSVADKLLAILCMPDHAITRVRDEKPGYLDSYPPHVAMRKPLVVICNQDCYSNAEIFAHAIKTLRRGKLVGVKTAGEVIATPSWNIMDVGSLRVPRIGFYTKDGQDMELRGAEPDCVVWPLLGEMPRGKDRQLEKGVVLLLLDVSAAKAQPGPRPIKAGERPAAVIP